MNDLISKIGTDKVMHYGIGGLIAAFINFICILQETDITNIQIILFGLIGDIVVLIISIFKEYITDSKTDWKDILAGVLGAITIHISICIGVLFNILSY